MLLALLIGGRLSAAEPVADREGWVSLFDGRSLDGWRASENRSSIQVQDGCIVCEGPRSHLFYTGLLQAAVFRNFDFQAEVKTRPGANSGIYFHTQYQEQGWPDWGCEVQIDNTAQGENGYRENKKTGSLYGIRNVHKQIVPDEAWFTLRIQVHGRHIAVWVGDVQTVDYVDPHGAPGQPAGRSAQGTFALQCHDPGSRVCFRNLRVRPLPDDARDASAEDASYRIPPLLAALHANNVPVADLHTHLKGGLTVADVLRRQYRTGINAGIAVNCGLGFAITNDAGIDAALPGIRHPLLFAAMQAEGREWVKLFSLEAIAQFDYVFTDAMTLIDDHGRRMRLWIQEEVEVGEPQAFMDMLVARTVSILDHEAIDVYVNPTFLPESIAGQYDPLWTPDRMDKVIHAAVRNGIAIEINDRFRIPHAPFIRRAKAAGAKFTFGTNNGGREDLGRLDHSTQMFRECGLEWQDMWIPKLQPSRAQQAAGLRGKLLHPGRTPDSP